MNTKRHLRKLRGTKKYKRVVKVVSTPIFARYYMLSSLFILAATTIYWSLLSAKVQLSNADQLVNANLFQSDTVLRNATFPGAHSFLLKWPLFWLVRIFGASDSVINLFTVGLVVLTIGLFVAIIYKIERRPLLFGTICLSLASVLLMIPATSYAGALLPLNMAMLSTRNIEYIIFISSLMIFVRKPKFRSRSLWLAVVLLGLLIASDKLFLTFAVGGAILTLVLYARLQSLQFVTYAVNWLFVGALATVLAVAGLTFVNHAGITHVAGQTSSSPYSLASSPKELVLGSIYGVFGILSNFGANPAYDSVELRNIPHQLLSRLTHVSGFAYIVNLLILLVGLFAIYKIMLATFAKPKRGKIKEVDHWVIVSVILVITSVVAIVSFIGTNHYYAVDARYLTILLFVVFTSFATYSRSKKWSSEIITISGLILLVSIFVGLFAANNSYNQDQQALSSLQSNDTLIAHVLKQHKEPVLVGDYWRVLPIKQASGGNQNILPLASCTKPLTTLSSTAWQPNLHHTGFAYLLTLSGNLTNYPNCSLQQILAAYGRPNASVLISGTISNPKESLLFYDNGIRHPKNTHPATTKESATVLPVQFSDLTNTTCTVNSVTNIVAHQDDDLLFMNPDLLKEIQAGDCIRSIYITAGDDGQGEYYWLSRQQGAEAAYSSMLGSHNLWVQKIVQLAAHEYVTIASPVGISRISLIFINLPDGNLQGQGFSASGHQSIAKLKNHNIQVINSVDHESYYTSNDLINALSSLMNYYQTTQINTQSGYNNTQYPDHSDHQTVNWYVKQAYQQFETQRYSNQVIIPIKYYVGYPVHSMTANVSGPLLAEKEKAFLQYAKFDDSVCSTIPICARTPTYNAYLTHEYTAIY